MNMGIVGLGRMGSAIAYRAIQAGHSVFGFDAYEPSKKAAQALGVHVKNSIEDLGKRVNIIWLMLPATAVDEVLQKLKLVVEPHTIIIDGGNSKFTDSIIRAQELEKQNILFLDCGTSGGLRGKDIGFCLMIGGNKEAYQTVIPLFQAIAAAHGYAHVGPSGAGHYVKMVHNGIEYALLQSYAEGFHLLKEGHFKNLDLAQIADLWNHGAVIRSWILELIQEIFAQDQEFKDISGFVAESGMGRWTTDEAQLQHIPVQLIDDALEIRYRSQETGGNYATKLVALLRNKFGGHTVKKLEQSD